MLHVRTAWPGDEAIHAHRGDCANKGCSGVAAFDRRVILHCCADVDRRSLPSPAMYLVIRRALRVVFSRLDEEPVAPTRTCHKLLTRSAHAFIQNTRCSCPANVATIHQASAFPNVRRVCLFAAACLRLFSARRFCHRCGPLLFRAPRSAICRDRFQRRNAVVRQRRSSNPPSKEPGLTAHFDAVVSDRPTNY